MKSEEFLLSQTLPSCSNHPSSLEQSKAGNPGRSVVLSTDTQPPSSFPAFSPLFLSHLICFFYSSCASQQFLRGIITCALQYQRRKVFCPLFILSIVPSLIVLYFIFYILLSYFHIKSSPSSLYPDSLFL